MAIFLTLQLFQFRMTLPDWPDFMASKPLANSV